MTVVSPDMIQWEARLIDHARDLYPTAVDPSHDMLHIGRVVANAKRLAAEEGAEMAVVIPAAYLHDCVNVPKNDPRRAQASRLSADAAVEWLRGEGYPERYLAAIHHAIAAHSFSAGIPPETMEAKVVQDADRLDALGAVGIARCFTVNGRFGTAFYCAGDFDATARAVDDRLYAVDHFFAKLLKLPGLMQTAAGRAEGQKRADFMRAYLSQMKGEVYTEKDGGAAIA